MTTPDSASAIADIRATLDAYGLGSLAEWAWDKVLNGEPVTKILTTDLRERPEYQQRFPGLDQLRKEGTGMDEASYIKQENSYKATMHAYGLPTGFYDSPSDFATLMTGHVSPDELLQRVQSYSAAVLGDTETLHQLRTLYADHGIQSTAEGDLLAYYLDPAKAAPILDQQLHAAQFASAASRAGYGQLTQGEAENFGARQGVSEKEAEQGFGALVQNRELFGALPGSADTRIGQEQQLGAMFGGDALAQEQIEKRRSERKAALSGGGEFASNSRTGAATGLTSNRV